MQSFVSIRPAATSDIAGMSLLLSQLFAIESDFTPDDEKQRRGLKLLLETAGAQILVAEVRGRLVGMVTMQTLVSTAEGGRVGLVEDLVLDAEYRGMRIGAGLLAQLQSRARKMGLSRLQLAADKTNSAALEFYRKVGWEQTSLLLLRRLV
jgi:ribosomal protein S18 acetylase RimI-like enzyme